MVKTITLIISAVILFIGLIIVTPTKGVVKYDCRLAEISPDYPVEVKNQCRKKSVFI